MSKYRFFSGPYFPVFGPEKTPYLDTFYAVQQYYLYRCFIPWWYEILSCFKTFAIAGSLLFITFYYFFYIFWLNMNSIITNYIQIKNAFNYLVLSKSLKRMSSKHLVTVCHAVDGGVYLISNIPLIINIKGLTQYSPQIFMLHASCIDYCVIVSHMMLNIHANACKFYKKEENLFFYYQRPESAIRRCS